MRLFGLKIAITVLGLCALLLQQSSAESYGLGFYSHEVVQDKRTSLTLNPGNALQSRENFSLTFDFSFLPNHISYFGYVMRLVSDNNQNIDLVYDNQFNTRHFKIILGDRLTKIEFDIPENLLFKQWNAVKLNIDFNADRLTLICGGHTYSEAGLHLKPANSYKLFFGANTYQQYQTTDVPPMKLRDVKVWQKDKLTCHWPLNEVSGNIANEMVNGNNGSVTNPLWFKSRHRNWQLEKEITITGTASSAFDAATETLYFVSGDSLVTYMPSQQVATKSSKYLSGKQLMVPVDQSIYINNNLYYIVPDIKTIAAYNLKTQTWDKHYKLLDTATSYGHLNKFYAAADTSIYTIGGYGQLVYKGNVVKYNIATQTWQNVKTAGTFTPRYLAGLGTTAKGDTAYILGGYGSATGQQIVNPRNLYDMVRYSVKSKRFDKLFELNFKEKDFVFANSLIINAAAKTYYGLIFPQHKYNSRLQMIQGSLDNAGYKMVGNTIPYLFHDSNSFADLYYCPQSQKFYTVTLLTDNNKTHISIYSLLSPPEPLQVAVNTASNTPLKWWLMGIGVFAVAGLGIYALRKKPVQPKPEITPAPAAPVLVKEISEKPITDDHTDDLLIDADDAMRAHPTRNSIFLFGDLQLFTAEGKEITKSFTPLLKELFLVIMLYSVKMGRGVSSEKLNEILWFGKSEKSARNNLSVNIVKLKSLLDQMGHYQLSKDTGYWKIDIDYNAIFVDYHAYLNIVCNKDKLDKQKIIQLTHITQRGNFLSNIEYEWLDAFKSDVSNEIIDSYLQFANSVKITDDPKFIIKIANDIFYFDPVNEEAMVLKCKALSYLGKHSLAKSTYENFNKEYREIYGEDFDKNFHAVVE